MNTRFLIECYPFLEKPLLDELEKYSILKEFKLGEHIVQQGQFVKYLPIVVSGQVRVFCVEDTIQFLLYYILSGNSCIYSFAHILSGNHAEFSAVAETDSTLLMIPVDRVKLWMTRYTSFGSLVLADYQKHYLDLLQTTKQLVCHNLEERLLRFLEAKSEMESSNVLRISHQEIADNLGTSREVITRLMKKLGKNREVEQQGWKIKLL